MRDIDVSKTAILEAAFDLLGRNPGASLSQIAQHAGVGRATLHRHFAGRAELLADMALTASEELDAAADAATKDAESHAEGLRLAFRAMLPLASRYMFLTTEPVDHDPRLAALYETQLKDLVAAIAEAQDEGAFDSAVPAIWIAHVYESLLYSCWAMVSAEEATPNQAADFAWRLLTKGLKG